MGLVKLNPNKSTRSRPVRKTNGLARVAGQWDILVRQREIVEHPSEVGARQNGTPAFFRVVTDMRPPAADRQEVFVFPGARPISRLPSTTFSTGKRFESGAGQGGRTRWIQFESVRNGRFSRSTGESLSPFLQTRPHPIRGFA